MTGCCIHKKLEITKSSVSKTFLWQKKPSQYHIHQHMSLITHLYTLFCLYGVQHTVFLYWKLVQLWPIRIEHSLGQGYLIHIKNGFYLGCSECFWINLASTWASIILRYYNQIMFYEALLTTSCLFFRARLYTEDSLCVSCPKAEGSFIEFHFISFFFKLCFVYLSISENQSGYL